MSVSSLIVFVVVIYQFLNTLSLSEVYRAEPLNLCGHVLFLRIDHLLPIAAESLDRLRRV